MQKWGGGLSWSKQHNFVIFLHISTKLGGEVYILLSNNSIPDITYIVFGGTLSLTQSFV